MVGLSSIRAFSEYSVVGSARTSAGRIDRLSCQYSIRFATMHDKLEGIKSSSAAGLDLLNVGACPSLAAWTAPHKQILDASCLWLPEPALC